MSLLVYVIFTLGIFVLQGQTEPSGGVVLACRPYIWHLLSNLICQRIMELYVVIKETFLLNTLSLINTTQDKTSQME